ncbi:glutathione-dependent disulfide-bond oxidoreductase [Alteromonas stellipolaris]|jgi:GST-like protein|uniref:Glutathione-dependent disulfide-bond oxidoreductase n=1 Tax=Alteromonas stellipolaris TaxID=233316 RepID=A0ABM5YFR5_9ALTE|nr:glutathione-dependent disulfide-bond oxidoreductase [Alteromonas stellipolaris]ALM92092.1 Glutathione S-transferase [Alteromonas stellipolaris LMG 21856]AMJ73091.1 glutathione-dependent disulfide-bond oxidoreductase [Alteromonas stellipolaris]AMJ93201.1 glutathione-dependent disulfide-bond oxidoreductase [Alteromonas stellipolaris]ANB20260.1 glutathione-dependent disulfide-bond oxidoreductase [Alteromonas stellipolaris]ANB25864.1 glutathione-dependent disulfide-bond oxidoreductase [Alteromo
MSDSNTYTPPKVWSQNEDDGNKWASINRPVSGATHEQERSVGQHPLQLYSLATPNGQKVTIMLEELLAAGITDANYDAWLVNIGEGDQFSSGFVDVNPNSKIPAMVDTSTTPETKLFESGSILHYLAEKFDVFIPKDPAAKVECFNWLFWQVGSAPYLGGGFGHFYSYAPYPMEYPINRFTMEVKRELDVLDKHLAKNTYFAGDEYSIADMAIWPWYGNLVLGNLYDAATFLQVNDYKHVLRWATEIEARPAVQRGVIVNRTWGDAQLKDRHSAKDIDDALNEAK